MLKAIIFDLDGVIIHTDHYHYLAWKKMCDDYGLSFDEKLNHQLRGVSRSDSLEIILNYNHKTYSDDEKHLMTDLKNTYYKTYLMSLTPNDLDSSVEKTLYKLKSLEYKLAIGSSSKNAKTILSNIGLSTFFDVVSDGTNIHHSKPNPEVFLIAAKWLGVEPSSCLVVEDAMSGIIAAKEGHMMTVYMGDAKDFMFADYHINEFCELLDIVNALK